VKPYENSDLACESFSRAPSRQKGVDVTRERRGELEIDRILIRDEGVAREWGKPCGTYVTFACHRLDRLSVEGEQEMITLLAKELSIMAEQLSGKRLDGSFAVFAVGLGNAELTADAVGPATVDQLVATRHLKEHEPMLYDAVGCSLLSTLAPGVLGQTGIEAQELIRGVVDKICPDVVLVIDALAARDCSRLASTVQLSDAGISPGSGVGNHRAAITKETLGVPVIALGVPTVVSSATLVWDALRQAGISEPNESLRGVLENGKSFFVSLKESDVITKKVSFLLASAIGKAFSGTLCGVD
jgi:spore protease